MEFKTSKQWKHQIGLTDDGFIGTQIIIHIVMYIPQEEFFKDQCKFCTLWTSRWIYFELLLKNGQLLVQEVKTTHRAKSIFLMGNTTDAARELSVLYKIL